MAGSSSAVDVSAPTQDLKYMQASSVNVSNFVSVKLSGHNNYDIWKAQILCLIESQALLHIIHAKKPFPEVINWYYDRLVKGWIFGSLNQDVLKNSIHSRTAGEVWRKLESVFGGQPIREAAGDAETKYMQASIVNVFNFVSVKLLNHNNYHIWKAQMLSLIQNHDLLYLIDENLSIPTEGVDFFMEKKFENLVKGWIFNTVDDQLLKSLDRSDYVRVIWIQLQYLICDPQIMDEREESPGFIFQNEHELMDPEIDDIEHIRLRKELYEAAVEGCWWKAKSILKIHTNAATEAITANGNTILHLAVEMGHNYFLERLLEILEDKDILKMNDIGETALHIATIVGNTQAAQLLVQKRKELLIIVDLFDQSPLDISYGNMMHEISAYLLKYVPTSDLSSYPYDSKENAIFSAILSKQYGLAETLLMKFPEFAKENDLILKAITITYPTDLGFTESVIYPSFHNVREKTVARVSLLLQPNLLDNYVENILRVVKMYKNTCISWLGKIFMILCVPIAALYPIYHMICLLILVLRLPFSMLYFQLWKVSAATVRPIKNIEKKKKNYKAAKKILSLICSQMGSLNDGYKESIIEAVRQDTYEVVDEILFMSPFAINCKDEEGHNIVQLTIMNRSEKVYNLINHIIESYRRKKDSSMNNLAHLVGRLAPSFVLGRTTGAALQLQRELIWREEVEKLMSPLELREKNRDWETPAMIFTREHQDLIKQGENWMRTTAESCSITAALIVTVVFAAAITVPGGSNQESGIPIFKKETAFTVFAVFNAFSLFTAATALLLFLSVLTSRFSERDFYASLPRRLIIGLLALFLSTTAMIVAFCAILFLVFCDQRPWMLGPICGFACLPISVIVTVKLPLLVDLVRSTYFPIFGKQSYFEACKVNRKNTIFIRQRKRSYLGAQLMT